MKHYRRGFTAVELLIIISVMSLLVGLSIFGFGSWQKKVAKDITVSDLRSAVSALENHKNFKSNYPPNLAGTGFAASDYVAVKLSTNAPSVGVYENLSNDQNAQLFLNSCNANIFTTPNNTSCGLEGNGEGAKIHVKGTTGTNAIWNSPVQPTDLTLDCDAQQAACNQAINDMITQFTAQGGAFPIVVPSKNIALPAPTQVPNGPANRYCIEGRSTSEPEVVYYSLSDSSAITAGQCPYDSSLHYYQ